MKALTGTDPRIIKALELYKNGERVKDICKLLRLDSTTLDREVKAANIKRYHGDSVRKGKTASLVRHDALDVLTSEALYWIGFLYADGHIEKDRPRIRLVLSDVDRSHLEKFASFFGEGIKVTTIGTGFLRVSFSSKRIIERLKELGFTNRKTYDIVPHPLLKSSRDFWRGCVDGDGWICNKKDKLIGLCGHVNTITEFLIFLNLNSVDTKTKPHKRKNREFLWACDLHSTKVDKTLTILYKDATVYLDRKYQTYLEICSENTEIVKN